MKSATTLGFLRVASAFADNICRKRRKKSVLIVTHVDVHSDKSVVVKHKPTVVVMTVRHRFVCGVEISPCLRIGRGRGFVLPCFHRDFAIATSTNPLIKFFQFRRYVLVAVHTSPLLFATLRSSSFTSFQRISCLIFNATDRL